MKTYPVWRAFAVLMMLLPTVVKANGNMRRDGPLTLNEISTDTKGFYAAAIDPTNGFAYFAAKYVYKVDISGALPRQVGTGIGIGSQSVSGAMDPIAGCAYFANPNSIIQVLANGTNAPSLGQTMSMPSAAGNVSSILIDARDPNTNNHYLYVLTEIGQTNSSLYKIALSAFPSTSAIIGSASDNPNEPALFYSAIDLTNGCAYGGTFVPTSVPYLVKFALGAGANPPTRVGGVALDTTLRAVGGIALDPIHGYGYCCSDGSDGVFGRGRVYSFALNGAGVPTFVNYADMETNEGFCHVALVKPTQGLLYFGSDLSYPAQVHRFRVFGNTNAPVETGTLNLLNTTNTNIPAWGYNPTNASDWGEVFIRSIAYDPIHDFVYFGRDCADQQTQPYTNQIVKCALDRTETLLLLTQDTANTNNVIPYAESFESYPAGLDMAGTNGWFDSDPASAVVITNNYSASYAGSAPIGGPQTLGLSMDGSITNRFAPSTYSNVWVDVMLTANYYSDGVMPDTNTLGTAPFALLITTNGHLAVWNDAPSPVWTELLDTSVASNQYVRVTVEANYAETNGVFSYRVWLNGVASTNPQTWYAAASTNEDSFGSFVALGHYLLDDLVVTDLNPFAAPPIVISAIVRNSDGTMTLHFTGAPNMIHRVRSAAAVTTAQPWPAISTNLASAAGTWEFTDTNAAASPIRFYEATRP